MKSLCTCDSDNIIALQTSPGHEYLAFPLKAGQVTSCGSDGSRVNWMWNGGCTVGEGRHVNAITDCK